MFSLIIGIGYIILLDEIYKVRLQQYSNRSSYFLGE